jgi:hypothetical protein
LDELSTNTVQIFFWFVDMEELLTNSDGEQFYQYQQTKRKFEQLWSKIPPISTNQKKVLTVMVNNSSNINKQKQSFCSDGRQFYQYQVICDHHC